MNDDGNSPAYTTLKPSTKQITLMEDRFSSWNMNGSVPILTFTGITSLTPLVGHLPLPSPLNQHGLGSSLMQPNLEEQCQSLMHTSSNHQDLVGRLAEVLKVQPMEKLPVSKAVFTEAISNPLAREILQLCPQAFAPGSVMLPSLGQYQKQTDENPANFATQSPTVKMARNKIAGKQLQESMVSVKSGIARSGNDKRLCFCGQVDSGKMVLCENSTCAYGWCHYSCVQVQRKPRRTPWFCPQCRRVNSLVKQGIVSEGSEPELNPEQKKRMNQTTRSKMSKKVVLGDAKENAQCKWVERSKTANRKKVGCGMVHPTEKQKWEATKAEWLKIAKVGRKDEGSSLTQRKPSMVLDASQFKPEQRLGRISPQKSCIDDQTMNPHYKSTLRIKEGEEKSGSDPTFSGERKSLERIEGRPRIENTHMNAGESSPVKLMDRDNVNEAVNKLAKLKSKEKVLKKKLLTSSSTELKLTELKLIDELLSVREEMIANQARVERQSTVVDVAEKAL